MEHKYLQPTKLNWLYIDLNSYFATIEQQVDQDLRNKPIAVVPLLSDTTCAIAVSIEAKLRGIKTGTRIYQAKKLCPELICIVAKHALYVQYHRMIFQEINKYLCVDHIFSIDEGACRLTGEHCQEEAAVKLAKQIKAAIKANVGEYISCSIGIASNRYLAKIATNMQKPDGLVVIKPDNISDKLYQLKLTDLPGVGRSTFNRLISHGITTVKQLYHLDIKSFKRIWGSIWGEKIWYLLRGVDLPIEVTKSSTISHSQVLAPELRNPEGARGAALSLLLKAAQRLRARDLLTSNIIVIIETADQRSLKNKVRLESTSDSSSLAALLLKCWDELIKLELANVNINADGSRSIVIKKVIINLTNLEAKTAQLSFSDLAGQNKTNKKQVLSRSIDRLNTKYGCNTVSIGQLPRKNSKAPIVAFHYIPEV